MTNQRGNILFLILLAVVLFAALSYAVTSSMRGGGKDGGSEKVSAQVSSLLNYYTQLDTAVQRMLVTGNVKDYELNFYYQGSNTFIASQYDNSNCTENRCRVFHPDGGGVVGQKFPDTARSGGVNNNGVGRIFLASVPGVGSELPDLVWVHYSVKLEVCKEINRRAGLDELFHGAGPSENATNFLYYYSPYPTGSFPSSAGLMNTVPIAAGLSGTFCGCASSTISQCETLHAFYPMLFHVLVAR